MPRNAFLIAAALLSACAQTPDYQRPVAPVPAQWPDAREARGGRIAAQTDWRTFFTDPRLQALIATALDHNRDLQIAAARVDEARAQAGIARADRFPTANLNLSRSVAATPGGIYGVSQPISNERFDFTLSTVSFELDFWGRLASLSDAARANYLATEEAQRALRLSLISDVAATYFALLEMEERVALARATVESREKSHAIISRGKELGAASNLEVLQAEGALESARAELAAIERQRASAVNALNLLVGRTLDELPPGRRLDAQDLDADLATGVPSDVLLLRPDVIAAEQRLIASHANIAAARAAFLPRILLTVGMGFASKALAALFSPGSDSWNYQPSMSLPLFDAGRIGAGVDAATARQNVAVADYEKTIQQAFREVADLLAARETLAEQLRATLANVRTQEERLKIAQARYKGGNASYLEVLDAQRELLAQQQVALQVRRLQAGAIAQLYKALGGGEPRPAPGETLAGN